MNVPWNRKHPVTQNKVEDKKELQLFDVDKTIALPPPADVTDKISDTLKTIRNDIVSLASSIEETQEELGEKLQDIESTIEKSDKNTSDQLTAMRYSIGEQLEAIRELSGVVSRQNEFIDRLEKANSDYRDELRRKNQFIEQLLMGALQSNLAKTDKLTNIDAENDLLRQRQDITDTLSTGAKAREAELLARERDLLCKIAALEAKPPQTVTVEVPVAMTTAQLLAAKRNETNGTRPKLPG